MKSLLADTKESLNKLEEKELNKYDFSTTFKTLYDNGLVRKDNIKNIDRDIKDTLSNIEELRNQKNKTKKGFKEIDHEIENYILESSINLNEAKKITSEIKAKQTIVSDHNTEIGYLEKQIENLQQEIGRIEKKYENLVVGNIPNKLKTKEKISNDLNIAAISTRERVFQELIERLEKEANKHYQNMIQNNLSARGIIKLIQYDGNYTPELIDSTGNTLTQVNTGNILLIKLATIMAIISARKTTRGTYLYTLISDAPMSVFGEDYTIGFCKTASHVYRQSIIMSKDFYKNETLKKELMTSDDINLGNVYMITPNIPESERENRLKLSTKIERLN
jgi:DNA sulfur modification protein DndD